MLSSYSTTNKWNVLRYGYQLTGKGKWTSMTLKKPKAKGGKKNDKKKQQQQKEVEKWVQDVDSEDEDEEGQVVRGIL